MKVKIWGARGSVPSPLVPAVVREKIISAMLEIANLKEGELRADLIAAILEEPDHQADIPSRPLSAGAYEQIPQTIQAKRRRAIEKYVDGLSPLAGSTAGGNTSCIEIRAGDDIFIIDAGSGIRELGLELMQGPCGRGEGVIHLFFSHPHWDHIQGFPFFRPAFVPGNKIYFYAVHDMEATLRRQQEFINFPISLDYMQADKSFIRLKPGQVLNFNDVRVRNIRNEHPGDAYGYRFEKGNKVFVYASDSAYPEGIDLRPYLNFFADADVLIFDAQFTQRESDEKEDWGHSSSFVGVEMAQEANVKNLVLFHYDPTYSDRELADILKRTQKFQHNQYPNRKPVKVMIAQEGQTFDLTPPQTTEVQQVSGSQAAILKPTGVFDEHVASEFKDQLAKMAQTKTPPSQLIIDMSAVEMLQVAGLKALVRLRKERQIKGNSMVLVSPSDNVRQLLDLAGYLDFFAIYDSIPAAFNVLQAQETLNLPDQILKNRYRIETKIGEGRLGTVYKATDIQQNSSVAIKVLSASFSEGAIEKFQRQARQIIELIHPNIVDIYDCDVDRGISFMVEEFIRGKTLQDLMDENPGQPLPFDLALSLAGSITRALKHAHANGVVHGDLKPKNALLTDEVKISDFGLGRLESGQALINIDVPLALVTARYLAPEQVVGQPIDARTDLYALGVILYEMFTGQPPFAGPDRTVLEQHRSQPPVPPRKLNANLSRSLEHLILKLLDKDPAKRYDDADQVGYILNSMSDAVSGEVQTRTFSVEPWPALAGRAEILQHLAQLWAETKQGRGQVVFIRGDSGLGKTRLAQELIYRLDAATVLVGECQQLEKSRAYAPFIAALETYFSTAPADVAGENVGRVWQDLARFMPKAAETIAETISVLTDIRPDHPAEFSASESFSLAESIARVTVKHPWLLILDNLHWADQSSVKLLDYLARHCGQMSLMIIGLYEAGNLAENQFLSTALTWLCDQANCTVLSPGFLIEDDIRKLLAGIWSAAVPDEWVTTLHKQSKGNPLYAKELAQGLVEAGIVGRRGDEWHFGVVAETNLPQQVEQAILQRVQRLSRETQTFLNQVAVLDPGLKFGDLHEMSDLSAWDALESLDTALQQQLLKEAPGEKLVRFSHSEMKQVIYRELSPLKRQLLHREAGEALERRYGSESKKVAAALTYHFLQAGELEKGLIYSIQAAGQARAIFAHQNALFWYSLALDVMDKLGSSRVSQEQRFELLLAREQIYGYLGRPQSQVVDLASLQSLVQALADPGKQARVHNRQAVYDYSRGRLTEAITATQAGLAAARQAKYPVLEVESLIQLAHLALYQGHFGRAGEHLHLAQERLNRSGNYRAEGQDLSDQVKRSLAAAKNLLGLGTLHRLLNNYSESERYYQQALVMNQQYGGLPGLADCLTDLGDLSLQQGDYTRAKLYQERALVMQQFIDNRPGEARCLNRLAAVYIALGSYVTSEKYVEQALLLYRAIEDEQGLAGTLHLLGTIRRAQGDYKAARDHAGQALEIFQHAKNKLHEATAWLEVALALEGLGEHAKASHVYGQAKLIQAEIDDEFSTLDARAGLARCLLAEGKVDSARQEVAVFLKSAGQTSRQQGLFGVRARYPVRLYLTVYQVLQAAGNSEEALQILQLAQNRLQKLAATIDDSELQGSFLENVPEHKELRSLVTGDHRSS